MATCSTTTHGNFKCPHGLKMTYHLKITYQSWEVPQLGPGALPLGLHLHTLLTPTPQRITLILGACWHQYCRENIWAHLHERVKVYVPCALTAPLQQRLNQQPGGSSYRVGQANKQKEVKAWLELQPVSDRSLAGASWSNISFQPQPQPSLCRLHCDQSSLAPNPSPVSLRAPNRKGVQGQ